MVDAQLAHGCRVPELSTTTAAQRRWARILTWVFAVATLVGVVLLLLHWVVRINPLPTLLFGTLNIPVAPSLVSVVVLGLLTGALVRRKRIALVTVAITQILGVLWSVFQEVLRVMGPEIPTHGPIPSMVFVILDVVAIVVGIATLCLLWWLRPAFPARTAPRGAMAALGTLVGGAVLTIVATHAVLLVATNSAIDDWNVLLQALVRSLGWAGPRRHFHGTVPPWLPELTSVLLALTIVLAVLIFLRSSSRAVSWRPGDEIAVRSLLSHYGERDSLGYLATRRDKISVFSVDGRACVTFPGGGSGGDRLRGSRGGSRGVDERRGTLARAHPPLRSAPGRNLGLRTGCTGVCLPRHERIGHGGRGRPASRPLLPGQLLDDRGAPGGATRPAGRAHGGERPARGPRPAGARAHGAARGRVARERTGPRVLHGAQPLGDPADGRCMLVVARDGEGTALGLLSFVPWGRRGLSLDVMRRSPQAPNGTTELMVSELMDYGVSHRIREVSLNFAMFRGVFEDSEKLGAGVITRFNSSVLGFMERFFQLESLYRANAKYLPEWVPRYACFDGFLSLPRMAIATAQVEGFLPAVFVRTDPQPQLDAESLAAVRAIEQEPTPMRVLAPKRSQQTRHRMRHARALAHAGIDPYPVGLAEAEPLAAVLARRGDAAESSAVRTSGRVRRFRDFGGVAFLDLTDGGAMVQVLVDRERVDASWTAIRPNLDIGDLVVVDGRWGASRTGTGSVLADRVTMAAKALQPVPFGSFENPEQRLRKRSMDLLVHPRGMDLLRQRSLAVDTVRRVLTGQGYREVETPVLNTVHGGASARPFRTYINAYGMDLTLRIAPELYLKRLLVAGSGPIFEVARNFRNEGADATHNPEFTALEAYHPFADYTVMRELSESMIKAVAQALHGTQVLPLYDVHDPEAAPVLTDVSGPWPVITVTDAVSKAVGRRISIESDFETLLAVAAEHDVEIGPGMGPGAVLESLYEELVEPHTVFPTFYCDFPEETSPLTAPHRFERGLVERWDLVVNGMELGTAYSELTDPVVQRHRLTEQSLKAAAGDLEAMQVDNDFLDALEVGMPPAGGMGIGLDRLVMLMTATTIRDVLSFPFVKPQQP